jgi:hypothetical protein
MKKGKRPSTENNGYWIVSIRPEGEYPKPTLNIGKWIIFTAVEKVDDIWDQIDKATRAGLLGPESKVSTAKPNPHSKDPKTRVICVYSYDWTDVEDVKRIRNELHKIGISKKIPYKSDIDTAAGKYSADGNDRISKYFE